MNPEGPAGLRLYRPTRLRNALRPQMGEAGNARGREPFREPGLRRTASRLEAEHQKRLGYGSRWRYRDCEEGAGKALTRTLRKPAGLLWCFGFIVPGFIVVVRIVTAPFTKKRRWAPGFLTGYFPVIFLPASGPPQHPRPS